MWEWAEMFTWLGKNLPWLIPLSTVVCYVGYHFGYSRGYDEGRKSVEPLENMPRRIDYFDTL